LHRLSNVVHLEPPADHRFKFSLFIEVEKLLPGLLDPGRIVLPVTAPVEPHDTVILDQDMVRNKVGELAAGESDQQQPPFERNALRAALADLASDRVVDHVDAAAAGFALYHIDEVFLFIVEGNVGSLLLEQLELCVRPRGGEYAAGS